RRDVSRARPARAYSLHGPIRGPELARRDADDDHVEEGLLRDRAPRPAGRASRSDSGRGVLSRLARISRAVDEAGRGGDPQPAISVFPLDEYETRLQMLRHEMRHRAL